MTKSPPQKSPATPKQRTSRRLVQSTLFPVKPPPEPVKDGDPKEDKEEKNDQDEEFCGSQSKRKRNPAAPKKTPPMKAPKKSGNRSANSTPTKKNGKDVVEDGPVIMPDLRLEAKLRGAELSRIWTKEGRQLHPFFACSKLTKKSQEATEVNGSSSFTRSTEITCAPIHVFENTQDDDVFLDWRNWTFHEETSLTSGTHLECTPSSIFEGYVECLSFDKVSSVSQPCKSSTFQNTASLDRCRVQQECAHVTSSVVPHFLANEQMGCYQHSKEVEDCEVGLFSQHTVCMKKSDTEQQNTFLEEREMSNHPASCGQSENCLWTYKYQPKNAKEVCGNNESVRFLSEWLRSWYERDPQTNEDDYRQGIDNKCTQSDSESEEDEVLKKKNVLLVTGPVGSGKSAAIYACAKEQGIKVLELSASECRTGASVKQRFGEAFKSRKFQRSVGNTVGSQNKLIMNYRFVEANGATGQDLDDDGDVVELISISDEECEDATGTSVTFACKDDCCKDKLVILFEDVDITFLEEGGFISAVQQIAKTANGPIILTSNCPKPVLPDSFDRLQVHFMLPSSAELYSHACMVCAAEKVSIPPYLLEQFIECCGGDIRKVFMHLQFWCQGRSFRKDTKMMRQTYGSLLFNVEAGHQMLPKLLPWDLPSQLSDLVEKEITKSLFMMEERSTPMEVDDNKEVQCSSDRGYSEMENIYAKKVAMLSRNGYTHECSEYTATDTAPDFSNDSSTPFPFPRRHVRRMHGVVLSSDSEDDFMKKEYPTVTDKDTNHEVLGVNSLSEMLIFPGLTNIDGGLYDCLTADEFQMSGMCNFADISCVPQSSFVPETQMDGETDFLSQTMSSGHFATAINGAFLGDELPVEDNNGIDLLSQTVSSGHFANTMNEVRFDEELPVEDNNVIDLLSQTVSSGHFANTMNEVRFVEDNNPAQFKSGLQINFDKVGNDCDAILEYSHQELEDSQSKHRETVTRAYQLMDECSRMDFNKGSKFIQDQKTSEVSDLVQDSWNRLRGWRNDLRQYVASEQEASQIVMLANGMSNLISETDMLLSKCQPLMSDSVEPSIISLEELDSFSRCDERLLLASTIAQHGFCFYTKGISSVESSVGCVRRTDVDIASEMLANTTNMMALGKLVGQGMRTSKTSYGGRSSDISQLNVITSEIKSRVFDAIQSIVPSRFKLTLRGSAYIEYLSSLRHISRSEASRLSKGVENTTRRRRRRVAPHYLSSGAKMLSPEEILLLDQYNLGGKTTNASD